jgi:PAS domain S-box-containing protein
VSNPAGVFQVHEVVRETPRAIWTWSRPSGLVVLSDRLGELTGFPSEELTSGGIVLWASRIHPGDAALIIDAWKELCAGGSRTFETEHRFLRKEGRWVWLNEHVSLVRGDDGEPRIVGTTRDVTAEHQAEEALRKSELRYRTLVEQANDVIFAIDAEGRYTSLNHAFESVTGWKAQEWIGRAFTDLIDPVSIDAAVERFRASRSGAQDGYSEYRIKTKSGRSITIEATIRTTDSDGQMLETIGIARDVTQRKEAEARAAKEKRLASLGQLATSVAHEFNNVLMSIMPFAELVQRRFPDDPRVATATGHIMNAVRRGREISQDVLRFAHPGKPTMVPVVVCEWLDEFSARVQSLLGPACRLERSVSSEDLAIHADLALLDQATVNLVVNAREAMPDGGTLSICAHPGTESGTVDIEFRDTGRGIPEPMIDHVFEPLFTTKKGGSGLGLTIAYQAMKQQDGSIQVRSVVGEGSTFTMTFRAAPPARKVHAESVHREGKRKILVVEDDEAVGTGLSAMLELEGFDVRLVANGLESKQSVADYGPDIVLLDVNLPDISGIEVYEQIRAVWPKLNVIFSTGHADAHALEDMQHTDAPSIMKPYDMNELMAVIATLPVT